MIFKLRVIARNRVDKGGFLSACYPKVLAMTLFLDYVVKYLTNFRTKSEKIQKSLTFS